MTDQVDNAKHKAAGLVKPKDVKRVPPQQQVPREQMGIRPPASPETLRQVQQLSQQQRGTDVSAGAGGKPEAPAQKQVEDQEVFDKDKEDEGLGDPILEKAIEDLKKRRDAVEARCEDMNLDDLLELDEVQQDVPIIPDKLVVKYRSLSQDDHQDWLRECGPPTDDPYEKELRAVKRLAMSVVSINGAQLPPFRDGKGVFSGELLTERAKEIQRRPTMLVTFIDMNRRWFDDRIDKLLDDPEVSKNG